MREILSPDQYLIQKPLRELQAGEPVSFLHGHDRIYGHVHSVNGTRDFFLIESSNKVVYRIYVANTGLGGNPDELRRENLPKGMTAARYEEGIRFAVNHYDEHCYGALCEFLHDLLDPTKTEAGSCSWPKHK